MDASSTVERSKRVRASASRDILRVCRRLYSAGLIAGQDGNVSVRLSRTRVLVTCAGLCKVDLTPGDLVELDLDGTTHSGSGTASSEVGMHLLIYRRRPDVHAIVHAHPPVATGFGVAGLDFMGDELPETILHLGGVPLVPYAMPGTAALADALDLFLAHHDAFLLANHGATTLGSTLVQAHQRMESLEHAARILLTARTLGRVNALSPQDGDALRSARRAAQAVWHSKTQEMTDDE
jgi:L-fuculose-phosphate aldolase